MPVTGVQTCALPISAEYAGATLAVLDVSPFLRSCPGGADCVVRADESLTRGRVLSRPSAAPAGAPTLQREIE